MKILADECIHTDLVSALKQADLDVLTASEVGLTAQTDEAVFTTAVSLKRASSASPPTPRPPNWLFLCLQNAQFMLGD